MSELSTREEIEELERLLDADPKGPPGSEAWYRNEQNVRYAFMQKARKLIAAAKLADARDAEINTLRETLASRVLDLRTKLSERDAEIATLRRSLAAITANYPQRQQMLPHIQRAMELLATECGNCGTVTLPWEGHSPCNPVLPLLREELATCKSHLAAARAEVSHLSERRVGREDDGEPVTGEWLGKVSPAVIGRLRKFAATKELGAFTDLEVRDLLSAHDSHAVQLAARDAEIARLNVELGNEQHSHWQTRTILKVEKQCRADSERLLNRDLAAARAEVSRERSGPRLVTEGPLPEGRLIIGFPKQNSNVTRLIAFREPSGVLSPNHDEFWFYDYGPLPQPPETPT